MTLQLLPTRYPDEPKHRQRVAESINELIKVRPPHDRTPEEVGAGVVPVNLEYAPGDIRRYGAVAGGPAGANTTALQRALNANQEVRLPRGEFDLDAQVLFNDFNIIRGEGRESVLKWNLAGASLLRGNGATTTRRFGFSLQNLRIDNTSRSNAGSIGLDLHNVSQGYFQNVDIRNVATAIRLDGPAGGGAFYNKFYGCECLTVALAIQLGTGANENSFHGCRAGDFTNGVELDNCSSNRFYGFAAETFTGFAFDLAPTAPALYTTIIDARIENVTAGSSIGFRLDNTDARTTLIANPMFVNLSANFSGDGLDTCIISGEINSAELRANQIAFGDGTFTNASRALIRASGSSHLQVRNAADNALGDFEADIVLANASLRVAGNGTGAANTVTFGKNTQTTVGAAGGASALPATPSGYLRFFVGTTEFVIPYYVRA